MLQSLWLEPQGCSRQMQPTIEVMRIAGRIIGLSLPTHFASGKLLIGKPLPMLLIDFETNSRKRTVVVIVMS